MEPTMEENSPEKSQGENQSFSLSFHGRGGTLLGIQIVNILLMIITLGLYYFWAKAKVRRYIWGHTAFNGDRFTFHGTGEETFSGWFKVILVFGLPFLALQNAPVLMGLDLWIQIVGLLLSGLLFLVLLPIAIVGTRRYRLSRTSLQGIRFSFRGKVKDFAKIFFACAGYLVITLGLYTPYYNMRSAAFLWKNSRFGNRSFGFDGEGKDLFWNFFLSRVLAIPTLGLALVWYYVIKTRYMWNHTTFEAARFKSTITFGGILKLYIVNGLLTIVTLGFAFPWVVCRTNRYYLEHLTLEGGLDLSETVQDAQNTSAFGEEMGDFLDLDLDIG